MKSAMFCDHANEVPQACPCAFDCYCKSHTCRRRQDDPDPRMSGGAVVTKEKRQDLREAALAAVNATCAKTSAGHHAALAGSWMLQTSNSFRRIGAHGDGDVLCATTQRSDGHPDLLAPPGVLDYVVAAQPSAVIALLDLIDDLESCLATELPRLEARIARDKEHNSLKIEKMSRKIGVLEDLCRRIDQLQKEPR